MVIDDKTGHLKGREATDQRENLVDFGFEKVPEQRKTSRVREHFDSIAGKYDMMNTLLSFGIHYLWKRAAVRALNLKPGALVLDVCGGTGDLSVLAAKRVGPSGMVVLSDINLAMMKAGKTKPTHASERRRLIHVQSDAENMAFGDNSFDAVIVGFGIRNLTHMEAGLHEAHRLLRPGGRFVCLEFSKPATAWFRWLYDVYSFRVMPVVSLLLTGSRRPFTYLPESIRLFPGAEELALILENTGFSDVTFRRLTNGIAAIHTGTKQAGTKGIQ